jgi:hypothetical protein
METLQLLPALRAELQVIQQDGCQHSVVLYAYRESLVAQPIADARGKAADKEVFETPVQKHR